MMMSFGSGSFRKFAEKYLDDDFYGSDGSDGKPTTSMYLTLFRGDAELLHEDLFFTDMPKDLLSSNRLNQLLSNFVNSGMWTSSRSNASYYANQDKSSELDTLNYDYDGHGWIIMCISEVSARQDSLGANPDRGPDEQNEEYLVSNVIPVKSYIELSYIENNQELYTYNYIANFDFASDKFRIVSCCSN